MYQKLLTRWNLTPIQLAKFFTSNSPLCWRDCRQVGNFVHIFWTCKHLTSFWRSKFRLLSSITGILIQPKPALVILNLQIEDIPAPFHSIAIHIFIAVRTIIFRHGKENQAPNNSEMIALVKSNFAFEQSFAYKAGWGCYLRWNGNHGLIGAMRLNLIPITKHLSDYLG